MKAPESSSEPDHAEILPSTMSQARRTLPALTLDFLRTRRALRSVLFAGIIILALGLWLSSVRRLDAADWMRHYSVASLGNPGPQEHAIGNSGTQGHPIDRLIRDARSRFESILSKRSLTLGEAAARYRERRGRHPPPGFDRWFAQAVKDEAIVVEELFDRIHHDINPFWAVNPREMRAQANAHVPVIRVRSGRVKLDTDSPTPGRRAQMWAELVEEMMPHLPDIDMAINLMDESRVLVPWDQINTYINIERASRKLIEPRSATSTYGGLQDMNGTNDFPPPRWITDDAPRYWDHMREACSPGDPGRNIPALSSSNGPVEYPKDPLPYMFRGFIQNFTQAQDPCLQPHLRGMHGTFVESVSMSTSHSLLPLFGESKLPQNNEMLIPAAAYLSTEEFFNGGQSHGPAWADKKSGLIWRGTASGGRNKEDTWWHFHRHRWVQMMNATVLAAMERDGISDSRTFSLTAATKYPLKNRSELLSSFSDVAFVDLECFPREYDMVGLWPGQHNEHRKTCSYTSPFMAVLPSLPMKEQFEHKFLPDVDGNSFSGRWRAFLQSTSLPLKATIYSEWHDDRLMPWVHFVPFDNSFHDIYALLEYFSQNDITAEVIATQGKEWTKKVLRREDMKLYVWRLLLEYARVVDDGRHNLAFVEDLVA